MVTLTKLLDMRIVANSLSESSRRFFIRLSEECSSFSISLRSVGESEKNAISEAETNPEAYNKRIANTKATSAPSEGALTVTPLQKSASWLKYESGSKEIIFS